MASSAMDTLRHLVRAVESILEEQRAQRAQLETMQGTLAEIRRGVETAAAAGPAAGAKGGEAAGVGALPATGNGYGVDGAAGASDLAADGLGGAEAPGSLPVLDGDRMPFEGEHPGIPEDLGVESMVGVNGELMGARKGKGSENVLQVKMGRHREDGERELKRKRQLEREREQAEREERERAKRQKLEQEKREQERQQREREEREREERRKELERRDREKQRELQRKREEQRALEAERLEKERIQREKELEQKRRAEELNRIEQKKRLEERRRLEKLAEEAINADEAINAGEAEEPQKPASPVKSPEQLGQAKDQQEAHVVKSSTPASNNGLNGPRVHAGGTPKGDRPPTPPEVEPIPPPVGAADDDISKLDSSTAYSMALNCRTSDPDRCLRLLHRAASLSPNVSAITHALACVLLKGTPSTRADAKGAIALLQSNVSVHHTDSMLTLAETLRTGRPQDNMARQPEDAARLCEAVLELEPDNTDAMILRANLYREKRNPMPTQEDETLAFKLYCRAASLGSWEGIYRKGHWLLSMTPHHGKQKQAIEGRTLVEKAAAQNHAKALFFLGHCFEYPNRYCKGLFGFCGKEPDYEKLVYHYYKRAADLGHADALNNVGSCVQSAYAGLKPDFDVARSYYERAIEAGSRDAYDNLAMLYETGMDGMYPERVSYTNALNYYRLGAKRDIPMCLMHLGNAHEDGMGTVVKKDRRKAEKYYRKALRVAQEYEEEEAEEQTKKDLSCLYVMNVKLSPDETEVARSRKALADLVGNKTVVSKLRTLEEGLWNLVHGYGDIEPVKEVVGDSNATELVQFARDQIDRARRGELIDLAKLFGRKASRGSGTGERGRGSKRGRRS